MDEIAAEVKKMVKNIDQVLQELTLKESGRTAIAQTDKADVRFCKVAQTTFDRFSYLCKSWTRKQYLWLCREASNVEIVKGSDSNSKGRGQLARALKQL